MNSAAPETYAPTKAPAPAAPRRVPGFAARKGQRGYTPMKFLGSVRGAGMLDLGGVQTSVAYQLDLYDSGAGRTGSGVLEGDLSGSAEEGVAARLRLEGGGTVDVTLQEIDADGAVFEVRGAVSARLSALL